MVKSSKKEDCIVVPVLGKKLLNKLFIDMHVTQGAELCLCIGPRGKGHKTRLLVPGSFNGETVGRVLALDK